MREQVRVSRGNVCGQIGLWVLLWVSDNFLRKTQEGLQELLVSHSEDAVPVCGRLVEKIFLAALPVGTSGTVVGPLIENGLECQLGVMPAALLEEGTGFAETLQAGARVGRDGGCGADEFVDGDWLELAFDANEIEFTENEVGGLDREIGGFIDQDVRAVVLVETSEAG